MTNEHPHPITPPPELVQELWDRLRKAHDWDGNAAIAWTEALARAAQWGWDQREPELQERADQELEACCKWLQCEAGDSVTEFVAGDLRAARRPRPSLKQQALNDLSRLMSKQIGMFDGQPFDNIRRALELLPDDTTP